MPDSGPTAYKPAGVLLIATRRPRYNILVPQNDPAQARLDQLRKWRNRPERDLGLSQLPQQFKREVEKPFKQLNAVVELWQQMLPVELLKHTRLESLQRGILKVTVDGSTRLYELDRLLRQGLERQLIVARKDSGLRKIRLSQGNINDDGSSPTTRKTSSYE